MNLEMLDKYNNHCLKNKITPTLLGLKLFAECEKVTRKRLEEVEGIKYDIPKNDITDTKVLGEFVEFCFDFGLQPRVKHLEKWYKNIYRKMK